MNGSWYIVLWIMAHYTLGAYSNGTSCKYYESSKEIECDFIDGGVLKDPLNNTETVTLNLRNSKLREIGIDAFKFLLNLECLDLAENLLEYLHHLVFSSLKALTKLNLSSNRLKNIHPLLFRNLTELKKLHLEYNLITQISHASTFATQNKLYYLALKNNRLSRITEDALKPLISLTRLYLSGNPLHCDCQLQTAVFWCAQMCLETGAICQSPSFYNGKPWTWIKNVTYCSLKYETLAAGIERQAGNDSDFCSNKRCHHETTSHSMDCTDVNLRNVSRGKYPLQDAEMVFLSLRNTGLSELKPDTFEEVRQLQYLSLGQNRLSNIDSNVFAPLRNLIILFLDNNILSTLSDESVFLFQAKLDRLFLTNNQLNFISSEVLQPLKSLKTLGLEDNPLVCDCKLAPAYHWCKARNISTGAICKHSGSSWEILEHSNCPNDVILIVAIVCAVLIVTCSLFVVLWFYRKRNRIRDSPVNENVTYDDVKQIDYQYYETVLPTELYPVPPNLPKRPTLTISGMHVYDDVGNVRTSSIYITPTH